jgi:hypothetical protein
LDLFDAVGGASILPDKGVVDWLAGFFVPNDRGLTLIGDPDRFELFWVETFLVECLVDDELRVLPDLHGVVFDPTGLRIDLLVLFISLRYDIPVMVEDHESGSCGSLID